MKSLYNFLLLPVCLLIVSCSNEINNKIIRINYGTSFGECIGYCKHELSLNQDSLVFRCSGWSDQYSPLLFRQKTPVSAWDSARVNFNIKSFFELQEVIGCPDCADGGAEWIEIKLTNGDIHKVTFEYGNEPTVLKNQIAWYRNRLSKNDCK
jgi:hypothetical protein